MICIVCFFIPKNIYQKAFFIDIDIEILTLKILIIVSIQKIQYPPSLLQRVVIDIRLNSLSFWGLNEWQQNAARRKEKKKQKERKLPLVLIGREESGRAASDGCCENYLTDFYDSC